MFRYTIFHRVFTKNIRQVLPDETFKSIEKEKEDLENEYLIDQLDFLNGNYTDLLKNGDLTFNSVNEQLDVHLDRFLAPNTPWLAIGGHWEYVSNLIHGIRNVWVTTKFHKRIVLSDYQWDTLVRHNAICMMYFVDTMDELNKIHTTTQNLFEGVRQFRNYHHPYPPIILIVRDEASPLLDRKTLVQSKIPVLDSWYIPNISYVYNKNGIKLSFIHDSSWERFFNTITYAYFRLAVAHGKIDQDILKKQVSFMECANQSDILPREVWHIIGEKLFDYNLKLSLLKTNRSQDNRHGKQCVLL